MRVQLQSKLRRTSGLCALAVVAIALLWPRGDSASANAPLAMAAGAAHTCALSTDGTVRCWGLNWRGQLGDGTTTDSDTPTDVCTQPSSCSPLVGAIAITAGASHTCTLLLEGQVECWGSNRFGELGADAPDVCAVEGLGTYECSLLPVHVAGLDADVTAIDAGEGHTCALTTLGNVKCWGDNSSGQLGDGTTSNSKTPVDVCSQGPPAPCSPIDGIVSFSAGGKHTCAISATGPTKCWGANASGQLGDGTTANRATPVDVCSQASPQPCSPLSGIIAAAAASEHTCALSSSGNVKCWGLNGGSGQLGNGTTGDYQTTPVDVCTQAPPAPCVPLGGVAAVASVGYHTCVITTMRGLKCWGYGFFGKLGPYQPSAASALPNDVCTATFPMPCAPLSDIAALATGGFHTCAVIEDGGAKCWGWNEYGQLGNPTASGGIPTDVLFDTKPPPMPPSTPTPTACPLDACMPDAASPTTTGTATATEATTPTATPTHTRTPPRTATPHIVGDADCNRKVGALDAAVVLQYDGGLIVSLPCPSTADVNGDGRVDALDALLILQFVAGLIDGLPP